MNIFDHLSIGISDITLAYDFYDEVLAIIGIEVIAQDDQFYRQAVSRGGTCQGAPRPRPDYPIPVFTPLLSKTLSVIN